MYSRVRSVVHFPCHRGNAIRSAIYYTLFVSLDLSRVDYRGSMTRARCSTYGDIYECKFLACQRSFPCRCHMTLSLHIGNLQTSPDTGLWEKGAPEDIHTVPDIFTMHQCDASSHDVQNASEQSEDQLACPTVYMGRLIKVKNAHVPMNIYPRNII